MDNEFQLFGLAHQVVIAITIFLPLALCGVVWKFKSPRLSRVICWVLAIGLVGSEVVGWFFTLAFHGLEELLIEDLPLHFCGMATFLSAWMLLRPRPLVFELAYFLGLTGTFLAIITPELEFNFPSLWFFKFFISHFLVVTAVIYGAVILKYRARRWAVLRVMIWSNVLLVIVALVNWLIGSNYMFLCKPPETAMPLFFLPWPWYLLMLEPVGALLCILLYLPFYPGNRRAFKAQSISSANCG